MAIKQLGNASATGIETDLPAGREEFIFPDRLKTDLQQRADYSPDQLVELLRLIGAGV